MKGSPNTVVSNVLALLAMLWCTVKEKKKEVIFTCIMKCWQLNENEWNFAMQCALPLVCKKTAHNNPDMCIRTKIFFHTSNVFEDK